MVPDVREKMARLVETDVLMATSVKVVGVWDVASSSLVDTEDSENLTASAIRVIVGITMITLWKMTLKIIRGMPRK
jgi:hypothetical protein